MSFRNGIDDPTEKPRDEMYEILNEFYITKIYEYELDLITRQQFLRYIGTRMRISKEEAKCN